MNIFSYKQIGVLIFFVVGVVSNIFAASLSIDELNIIADGAYDASTDKFGMNTYFDLVSSFDGGYKFSAKISFEANISNLAINFNDGSTDFYNKAFLIFKNAIVSARNLADSHLTLTFWTGTYRYLGNGNYYRGFLYYPNSQDEDYEGFYRLRGTGITTKLKFWNNQFRMNFHLYQNTNFVTSDDPLAFYYFSFDTELGFVFNKPDYDVKFMFFGGLTFPVDRGPSSIDSNIPYGRYKVGMSFLVGNQYVDFFTCFGIPDLDNNFASTSFDSFYLMGELHFKIAVTDHRLSFLTRPLRFNERKQGINHSGEKNDIDVNYTFNVQVNDFPLTGGFQLNFRYSQNNAADLWHLYLSPYLSVNITGVIWKLAVHYDFSRLYQGYSTGSDYKTYLEGLKLVIGVSSRF